MSLDLFQNEQAEAVRYAARTSEANLPAGFGDTFGAAWSHATLFSQSIANRTAKRQSIADYADELFEKTQDPRLHPAVVGGDMEGLNKTISAISAETGQDLKPLTDDELNARAIRKSRDARDAYRVMSERERISGGSFGSFLGDAAGQMIDPINLVTLPLAAPASLGIIKTAAAWGGIGVGTQAAIEAVGTPYRSQVDPTYSGSTEQLGNLAGAAVAPAILGGGIKAAANTWVRIKTGSWPQHIRDAGNVVESEAQIAGSNPFKGTEGEIAHRTALQKAIDDMIAGRPVEVDDIVGPSLLTQYNERLYTVLNQLKDTLRANETVARMERDGARLPGTMERLSEQQLLDIRAGVTRLEGELAASRAALAGEGEALAKSRAARAAQDEALAGIRSELEGLRSDLELADRRIAEARPPTDEATTARLAQIEADLAAPALPKERRAALETERSSITETLAKTEPADRRLLASLEQEKRGLTKALASKEKALAKAEAAAAKAEEKIASREASLPGRQEAAETRHASRREIVVTQLRKAITRLAQEGYGVHIGKDEAQALAEQLAKAGNDNDAGDVVRAITEGMVDRKLAQRVPQPDLPFGTTDPLGLARTRAELSQTELRKRVTALAREMGYEMPREEAKAIAGKIGQVSEQDALAILDEVMLRPRTVADTLPGASAPPPKGRAAAPETRFERAAIESLTQDLTPKRQRELRADSDTDEGVKLDLDRLRAEKGKVEYPAGQDAQGKQIMRNIEDDLRDVEAREKAAAEIMACAKPAAEAAA